jgi:hypothetical protein
LIYDEPKPEQHIEIGLESVKEIYRREVETGSINSYKIKEFLDAQKALETLNFLKVIGHNPQGIITYLIFGFTYPKQDNDQLKSHITDMIQFINSR